MFRPLDHATLWHRLRQHLLLNGPTPAADLYRVLDVSAATLSRLLGAHREEVRSVGRARATRHALQRPILGDARAIPVFEVGADGGTTRLGELHPVAPAGFLFEGAPALQGAYPGLPWFLDDLRPSGFLGRLVPAQHPDLAFPADVRDWSVDQALHWLVRHGADPVGNLIVGDPAFARFLASGVANPVSAAGRAARYPALAADAMAAGVAGSSAGGEQPKFLASVADVCGTERSVLVKFSPPTGGEVGARVADLLVCEHLALREVAAAGLPAASSAVLAAGGRVFLEVERFDRTPGRGRRGLVSLRALDAEYVGAGTTWSEVCAALHAARRIPRADLERGVWLERFGAYIGNSDRHLGNLSFLFERGILGGLAPVYDMLPMRYAPRAGEVVPVTFHPPSPDATFPDVWVGAWRAAVAFWRAVAADERVTPAFRAVAVANADRLGAEAAVLRRLPGVGAV